MSDNKSAFGNQMRKKVPTCAKRKAFNRCVVLIRKHGRWETALRSVKSISLGIRRMDRKRIKWIRDQTNIKNVYNAWSYKNGDGFGQKRKPNAQRGWRNGDQERWRHDSMRWLDSGQMQVVITLQVFLSSGRLMSQDDDDDDFSFCYFLRKKLYREGWKFPPRVRRKDELITFSCVQTANTKAYNSRRIRMANKLHTRGSERMRKLTDQYCRCMSGSFRSDPIYPNVTDGMQVRALWSTVLNTHWRCSQ